MYLFRHLLKGKYRKAFLGFEAAAKPWAEGLRDSSQVFWGRLFYGLHFIDFLLFEEPDGERTGGMSGVLA